MAGVPLMSEDWHGRWREGRIGWHEADGNAGLKAWWPETTGRVIVPLCGKSPDLLWLARRGHAVVGIELSPIAAQAFFDEQRLAFEKSSDANLNVWRANELPIEIVCGDYFDYRAKPFDALYDRGALVAFPENTRPAYVRKTNELLRTGATRLVITLEYDQQVVDGPPFAVWPDELLSYWDDLERKEDKDDIDNCPPTFRKAGLTRISEVFWLSRSDG